ncbi:MAG TPA: amidohydrolase [Drouetiella sp.]
MKRVIAAVSILVCSVLSGRIFLQSASAAITADVAPADIVVTGAEIYTVNGSRSWAHALAVKDGKFVFVGEDKPALRLVGPATKVLQMHGEMILPGFHDSHIHPIDSGIELSQCRLDEAISKADVLSAIAKYVKEHPTDPWILGGGWSLPLFPNACPLKEDLDKIIPDRPAYFGSQDAHSAWVNSAALKLAKIDKTTPNPSLGIIERKADGEPSGTLRESATDLVSALAPKPSDKDRQDGLLRTLKMAGQFGITSLQDANADEDSLRTYEQIGKSGNLTVRVVACLHVNPSSGAEQVNDFVKLREKYSSEYVRPTSAKIFADGVVESHTAALLEPYSDKPDTSGTLNFKTDQLNSIVNALDKANFQVHVHAIGDRAVNEALNALEFARKENGFNDNRHHIAHLELIKPADIARFRKLNVVANFQPFWAYKDPYITECTEPLLGPERTGRLYQINSVMKTGAVVAAGSDWSVTTMNPLDAIQIAVTRKELDDKKGAAWIPNERVSLPEILASYTINGAYINHQETVTGSIEAGKDADFIVLDKNLFVVDDADIHKVTVLSTYLRGKPVFQKGE